MTTGRINQVAASGSGGTAAGPSPGLREAARAGLARAARFRIFFPSFPSFSTAPRPRPGRQTGVGARGGQGGTLRSGLPAASGRRFTRFARIMSSRGFADARSRQAPPPDIKLQSTAEKASARRGRSGVPLSPRACVPVLSWPDDVCYRVLRRSLPTDPARGAGVRCGYGGASLFPCHLRFHPCQPRLAWPQGPPGVPWTTGVLLASPCKGLMPIT